MTMELTDMTLQHIADRVALILGEWLNVSPARKVDNGDPAHGGMTMLLGMMAQAKEPAPTPDIVPRMSAHLLNVLRAAAQGSIYLSLRCDYGPDRTLADLSEACDIKTSWPWKTTMTVTAYADTGISVRYSQGYRAPWVYHQYLPGEGWLVSACSIDRLLVPTVRAAIKAGTIDPEIAKLDPFTC